VAFFAYKKRDQIASKLNKSNKQSPGRAVPNIELDLDSFTLPPTYSSAPPLSSPRQNISIELSDPEVPESSSSNSTVRPLPLVPPPPPAFLPPPVEEQEDLSPPLSENDVGVEMDVLSHESNPEPPAYVEQHAEDKGEDIKPEEQKVDGENINNQERVENGEDNSKHQVEDDEVNNKDGGNTEVAHDL